MRTRTYAFVALPRGDHDGERVTGVVRAAHQGAARAELAAQDLRTLELVEKRNLFQLDVGKPRVSRPEVLDFTANLQSYVASGVGFLTAFDSMASESSNPAVVSLLKELSEHVSSGKTLTSGLAAHPKVFSAGYVAMVAAAEASGRLEEVLGDLSRHLEEEQENRAKMRAAATYPLIVVVLAVVTLVLMATVALPRFATFFEGFDAELPLSTRLVMGAASLFGTWGWLMGVILAAGVALAAAFLRTADGQAWRDRTLLKLPVVKGVVRSAILERFTRVLGSMLGAGVPVSQALELASAASGNRVYQDALLKVREAVEGGEGVNGPLARSNLFPADICAVVRTGEEAGRLDASLTRISALYGRDTQRRLAKLTTYFEPALLCLVGGVVGFVALAMVSAMYGVFDQVQ